MATPWFTLVNGLHFKNLRGDLYGGITAAVVALPLALAFGVSSGAGAIHGLYGAIFVGFFAALFGGTPSQISGPTGPMTVVMATIITTLTAKHGVDVGMAMAFTVVMLGGLFQFLFGVFKLGKFITLIPYTVISGFMSGIGVIIILLQIGPLLGQAPSGNVMSSLLEIPKVLSQIEPTSAGLGVLTLAIVFLWPPKLTRVVPAPLLALIICTLLSVFVLPDNPDVRVIGEIPAGLPVFQPPNFNLGVLKEMVGYGIMLAILGAIDSLLTSLVADNVTRTQHNSDRELMGQGVGNLLAGLFGGLPGAGATMRTVINAQAGGSTPLSGMVHALVLLIIVLQASSLTEPIPHSVLAGILIKVGIDIIDWVFLKRAHKLSLKGAGLMYLVLFLTVFVDLITAVAVGAFIANLLTVKSLTDLQVKDMKIIAGPTDDGSLTEAEQDLLTQMKGQVLLFSLGGPMSFGAAKAISQRMKIVEEYEVIILDLSDVPRVGVTASLAIENMLKDALQKGHAAFLVGANGQVKARLKNLDIIHDLPEHHWSSDRLQALQQSLKLVQGNAGGMAAVTDAPSGYPNP
ncbi:MAG: SulP family inorganic anion transporter [Thermosynechococcaceae cyanobacterium]